MLNDFSVLFDHNPSPMWIYELPSLRILKVNAAAIAAYGYTEKEFLAMAISDIRPRFNLAKFNEYLIKEENADQSGFITAGVWKHQSKQGDPIYAEISGRQIQYADSNCRIIVATDVTEKIRSQEEVKIREQFLSSLIDSQTNFLIRIDVKGDFTFLNRQFLKTFGYTAGELVGKHFSFMSPSEGLDECEAAFAKCIDQPGKVIKLAHKKRHKAGHLFDTQWELISIVNEEGIVTEIQGIGRDITQEKIAEKEIALTQTNLEGLIDNTDDLIWSIDRERGYVYMNKAYKDAVFAHTGVVPVKGDKPYTKEYIDSYGQPLINEWRGHFDRAFNGERFFISKQGINYTPDNPVYFETYFSPIYAADGEIVGVGCFSRNIAQRLRTERALIEQNNRLKHIATLSSHELRRPVASMLGLINVLDRENFSNPANEEIIDHLFTVTTEIDTVIHQIVDKTFIGDVNME